MTCANFIERNLEDLNFLWYAKGRTGEFFFCNFVGGDRDGTMGLIFRLSQLQRERAFLDEQ